MTRRSESDATARPADPDWVVRRLVDAGIGVSAARREAEAFALAAARLPATDHSASKVPAAAFFVPGRIEVLGKHTDYAGGSSMVVAAERGFCLVARPRDDGHIRVTDADCGDTISFRLDGDLLPKPGHWSNYPMTVARRIARNFPEARCGVDVAFVSDLPPAAGMSSSSAMVVATFLALAEANVLSPPPDCSDLFDDPIRLAGYLGTVENGQSFGSLAGDSGVGTFGGNEDHTAILCARPGHISQFAYCPVRFQRALPMPEGYVFVVGSSGVTAEKTGSARADYNRASRLVSEIVELWHRETGRDEPTLAAILAGSREDLDLLKKLVEPGELARRLEHFIVENQQILPAAGEALARVDLERFGSLVDDSQRAAERLLGNQIEETAYLAASAREIGAVAASAFGAGFGGSVWAMIRCDAADTFLASWSDAYRKRFPQHFATSTFFTTAAGPAAFRL